MVSKSQINGQLKAKLTRPNGQDGQLKAKWSKWLPKNQIFKMVS